MFHDHHLAAVADELDDGIAGIGHNGCPDITPAPKPVPNKRSFRCLPDSYHHGKDVILKRCVEVICAQGLEPQDIRPRYASWRREHHTRLLREEWHYFGLDSALILAAAVRVKVDITAV